MKIAYFSPFSPDPSGISDFSEELIFELAKHMEIDLFARRMPTNQEVIQKFNIFDIEEIENDDLRKKYDILVYQVGNNIEYHEGVVKEFLKYPGILELHDFSLHHYLAESTFARGKYDEYIRIMKYCHGSNGEKTAKDLIEGKIAAPWETQSERYTVNKHLIDKAKAVIVHSDMAKQMVKGIRPEVKVINIPLHTTAIQKNYKKFLTECKKKLDISQDILVMGSFGYANSSKRISPILNALSLFKKRRDRKFCYYVVGKVQGIDIDKMATDLGIKDDVVVTGFIDLDDFKVYMGACDFCFNLRYPTQGESSASLHRMLGMGKPALVTDIGTFEEYSEDFVIKISHDDNEIEDIYAAICKLNDNKKLIAEMSNKAYEYAIKNCSLDHNAKKYKEFFEGILDGNISEGYLDIMLDRLYALGIANNEQYFEHFIDNDINEIETWITSGEFAASNRTT